MKLLCAADAHLGASPDLGAAPIGPESRLADQQRTWEAICQAAVDERCEALLFAGDAFHHRRPAPSALMAFRAGLDILRAGGVPIIAIPGNHDITSAAEPSAMSVFDGHGLRLCGRPEIVRVSVATSRSRGLASLCVCCLPWTPPHRFEGDNADLAMALVASAAKLRADAPGPAVLLAHWSVRGARLPTDMVVDSLPEPILPASDLLALGFDAVVLGHIHVPQTILGPSMFYCGSPQVVDFGEADTAHGYWMWEDGQASFHQLWDRPFRTIDVTLGTGANGAVALEDPAFYADSDVRDAIVRLLVTVDEADLASIDQSRLRWALQAAGAHRVYQVRLNVVRHSRSRAAVDEGQAPMDALEAYIRAAALEPAASHAMLSRTRKYLEEDQ